jgi:cytochrome c553
MRKVVTGVAAVLALALATGPRMLGADDDDEKKPKYTIKEVMNKAHKGGILKKVLSGKAEEDDVKELVIGYTALSLNKPPRGDAKAWKKRTEALVKAAKAVEKNDTDKKALAALKKASNCAACHNVHKGEDE